MQAVWYGTILYRLSPGVIRVLLLYDTCLFLSVLSPFSFAVTLLNGGTALIF